MTTADEVFLSRVGHDLRGELTTIVSASHYILRYEPNVAPKAREMLERIDGAGQRMRRLLDEFDEAVWLDGMARAELTLEPAQTSLIVKEAIERLSPIIQSHEVTLDVRVPEDLPAFDAPADVKLCRAAIAHVIDFALARSRKKTVHIRGHLCDGLPTLSVTDEGGAIDAAALSRLFEPFFEMELLPKREPGQRRERLGLGLAIARGILSAYGGGLRAEIAAGGKGLTLHCTLLRPVPAVGRRAAPPEPIPVQKIA